MAFAGKLYPIISRKYRLSHNARLSGNISQAYRQAQNMTLNHKRDVTHDLVAAPDGARCDKRAVQVRGVAVGLAAAIRPAPATPARAPVQ